MFRRARRSRLTVKSNDVGIAYDVGNEFSTCAGYRNKLVGTDSPYRHAGRAPRVLFAVSTQADHPPDQSSR